jgi:diguanylate cyclase (GGDEF)-like protein/PAS domain S-box-containing protein
VNARWIALSTRRPTVPFLAAIALAFAVWPLPPHENQSAGRIALAAAAAPLVLILPLALSRALPSVAHAVPLFGFLLVVALLRDGTGGVSSGYVPLVLLPALWIALHGGRTQLGLAIAGVGMTLGAPILLVGGPQYPVGEWRRAILWVVVTAIAGIAIQRLVAETRRLADRAREAADAVREREEHYSLIIDTASDAFVSIDSRGVIRQWNQQAERIFGWSTDEAIGLRLAETIIPPRFREAHERGLERLLTTGEERVIGERLELAALDSRGREFPVELCVWPVRTRGALTFNAFVRDISDRKEAEVELARSNADLERFANDAVTGLPSRLLFLDRTALALKRRRRGNVTCAVLLLDLDGFKSVNDSFGHAAGDELLRAVGSRLQTVVRPADTVARLGGDEYTILCEDIGREENVLLLAERVAEAVASPFQFENGEIHLTASIGLALAGGNEDSPDALLRAADAAMYQAKEAGARYELYDESIRARVIERAETQNALHRAIELEEFCLRYQPCVRLSSSAVIGAEALLRWEHPQRGTLAPCEFVPLAEETGLIAPIGNWALEQACQELARWRGAAPEADPLMLVNLSPRQLADPDFPRLVAERLDEAQVARSSVCLEITESALLDVEGVTGALRSLKDLDLLVGIDDFGTGYSSLAHLKRLPADVVKIDRSFVAGLGRDLRDTAIVAAILELARALGIRAIAEGVETPEQVAELRELGCELAQGYFFERPKPGAEVEAMFAVSRRAA